MCASIDIELASTYWTRIFPGKNANSSMKLFSLNEMLFSQTLVNISRICQACLRDFGQGGEPNRLHVGTTLRKCNGVADMPAVPPTAAVVRIVPSGDRKPPDWKISELARSPAMSVNTGI